MTNVKNDFSIKEITEKVLNGTYVRNECDKLKFNIPSDITGNKWLNCKGLGYQVYTTKKSGTTVTITGKFTASPDNLGSINADNLDDIANKLSSILKIDLSVWTLLSRCQIYLVDVKKDILVDGKDCRPYITALREVAQKNTKRTTVTGFKQKTCAYDESLLIRTTTKRKKKSLSIYSKYKELINGRHKDKEYFGLFSEEFLEYSKRLIRFEVRLNSFEEIRKAFGIRKSKRGIVISQLFYTDKKVIADAYKELVLGE